ncbi:lipid II:glycine glycyltransferase FemX [Macrococcoides caseolyticum]|uniref:lipid II:glycine glycyltransferase FemX n=1 Tax=Macrococcoides caseolyticum TaxID=69966 RepID=UPI001F1C33D1|nr:lipid II:glycine glycyltransferase FemX [Macrococcus caseolyticus]MCE4956453.1 lipid II:glycine glycyltransferase FemX [Macrococcus caseolyticus]
MTKINITNEMHDTFVKSHPNGDLLQLTDWAVSKKLTHWYSRRIAVARDGELVGVGQLLFKKVPKLPFTMCYVSRGFVVDYSDKEAVEALVKDAITVAKREKAYVIKIDPDVEVEQMDDMVEHLESIGFIHRGFKEGLSSDYIQPRMTMITDISVDDETLIQSFERNNRSKVKRSLKMGTECVKAERKDLQTFADLMKITGERDGFLTRDVSYFENIYDALNPNGDAELFLVKLVPVKVLNNLNQEIGTLEKEKLALKKDQKKAQNQLNDLAVRMDKLKKQIAELEALQTTHPEGKVLSGALLTFSGHKSYYLYGASSNEFRDYLPNHNMQFSMMQYARSVGAKSYDFGGTNNNPDKDSKYFGLWQFKKVWGTRLSEKVGEFDYVLNQPMYQLIEVVKPKLTDLKKKIQIKKN